MSRTLSRTHSIDHSSTHRCILHKHSKSLCAWNFLSCLTFCQSASSFDKQVDSVKEHFKWPAHRLAHTLSLFVCGLVTSKMLLWFGLYKSCHHSTATSLAKTQLPIAGSPEKALNFFSFESATASCVSSGDLVATFSDVCGSRLVSAGTPRFSILQSWHWRCPRPARSSNSVCWTRSPEKKE